MMSALAKVIHGQESGDSDPHTPISREQTGSRVVLFSNTSWYLYNFRLQLLETLRSEGYDVVLVSPRDTYTDRLIEAGFEWRDIELDRRSVNPLAQVGVLLHLWKLWRQLRPHTLHLFTIKCVVLGGLSARLARVPRRVHAIAGLGSVYSDRSKRWLRIAVTAALRLATAGARSDVIVQNPDDAALLVRQQIVSRNRVHLIRGSGVDGERFRVDRNPAAETRIRFLFAARLLWAKGIRDFVKLAEQSTTAHVEFMIAGEPDPGNPDSVDNEFLQRCQQVDNLTMLGHVDDMAALLRKVSVMVLPSSYGEGVPRTLVESAAASLPLIAYDVPGSREIVLNGRNGFLCQPGDFDALQSAANRLAQDPALRQQFGEGSRMHFETEYDQRTVNRKTLDVYRGVAVRGG
ncbi:MAG: glycosyltransferase family 4 protein [Pseudomonadota bacterium]